MARFKAIYPYMAVVILLAVLAGAALLFVRENWNILHYPYALDFGEGVVLDQSLRLARFETLYPNDFAAPPYIVSNYPPVFLLAQVIPAWLFGPAFWYGRLVSILSALFAALFVGLIVHALSGDRFAGLVSGATLLAVPCIVYWSGLDRIDSLALCLSTAGLYVVVRHSQNRVAIILASVLFVASIYTRQSYAIAAPCAAFIWLISGKQFKPAAWLAGISIALTLAAFLILNAVTHNGFFQNVILANAGQFDWPTAFGIIGQFILYSPLLITAALAVISGVLIPNLSPRNRSWRLITPYLVGGFLSLLALGKGGSNINYLYELAAGVCMVAGLVIAARRNDVIWRSNMSLLLAIQVGVMIQFTLSHYARGAAVTNPPAEFASLKQLIQSTDGLVIADESVDLIVLSGRSIYYEPFARRQLIDEGLWNPASFIDAIHRQDFAMILIQPLLAKERWTREMLGAIETDYTLDQVLAGTNVYVPRKH